MNDQLFDLSGKVAMVTGTSRGLGQYFARALARAGADISITSRDKQSLSAFADEVQKETAICFVCKKRPAVFTQKLISSDRQVEVGDFEIYQARCRVCHELPKSASLIL